MKDQREFDVESSNLSDKSHAVAQAWTCLRDLRMLRGQRDVQAHNIPGHRDVKLNELAKQISMLLPLLLMSPLFLYVLTA